MASDGPAASSSRTDNTSMLSLELVLPCGLQTFIEINTLLYYHRVLVSKLHQFESLAGQHVITAPLYELISWQ